MLQSITFLFFLATLHDFRDRSRCWASQEHGTFLWNATLGLPGENRKCPCPLLTFIKVESDDRQQTLVGQEWDTLAQAKGKPPTRQPLAGGSVSYPQGRGPN